MKLQIWIPSVIWVEKLSVCNIWFSLISGSYLVNSGNIYSCQKAEASFTVVSLVQLINVTHPMHRKFWVTVLLSSVRLFPLFPKWYKSRIRFQISLFRAKLMSAWEIPISPEAIVTASKQFENASRTGNLKYQISSAVPTSVGSEFMVISFLWRSDRRALVLVPSEHYQTPLKTKSFPKLASVWASVSFHRHITKVVT